MGKRPQLMIMGGGVEDRRYEVTKAGIRLGRSSSNDIHVPDEELSRNHCFFEAFGEEGIRLTDLASANGTFVNGKLVSTDPVELHEGDIISVGKTVLKVVGDTPPVAPTSVDLGLGDRSNGEDATPAAAGKRPAGRNRLLTLIIGVLAIVAIGAVALVLLTPPEGEENVSALGQTPTQDASLREFHYEKVTANSERIFRYELTLSAAGDLRVEVDDVPAQNRHLVKEQHLDEPALKELGEILDFEKIRKLDREYAGVMPEPPVMDSAKLTVVYGTFLREVCVVNVPEPEAFRSVREKLEAFSKNQLGVWALQYSREKLIELSQEAIALAKSKWEDRDVRYGNLYEAMKAYEEAIFYLETVNPKPDCHREADEGLRTAKAELEKRFKDQRFLADRAINLAQWETAQRELLTLIEMVPNRNDARYREAKAKLVDVEKRLKGDRK